MDYMNLGVKSRKTGIQVKGNIGRDEYSMENIDEFFKDDDTLISARRKSRRSSLLPLSKKFLPEDFSETSRRSSNYLPPSVPTIQEEDDENLHEGSDEPAGGLEINETLSRAVEDNRIHQELSEIPTGDHERRLRQPAEKSYEPDYRAEDDFTTDAVVPQTPPSDYGNESYRDVPDLVADDDDDVSHGNTTFNTSDNALLEDELQREVRAESEEDRDYIERYSNTENSDSSELEDEDNSDTNSPYETHSAQSYNTRVQPALSVSRGRHPLSEPQELSDTSDEEFIYDQARELASENSFTTSAGLRKSKRVKVAPLEYWRNEKVVYKRKSRKPVLEIDKIITYEDEDDEEEEISRRRKSSKKPPYNYGTSGKPRGRPRKSKTTNSASSSGLQNPNEDLISKIRTGDTQCSSWMRRGVFKASVKSSFHGKEENEELLACAPDSVHTEQRRKTADEDFSLAVLFDQHRDLFASGFLTIPTGSCKKLSDSRNAFINFYLIQGVIEVTVGRNKLLCTDGTSFQIPAFNEYAFRNKGKNDAKMYFVQTTIFPRLSQARGIRNLSRSPAEARDNQIPKSTTSPSDMSISEL
ncbi:Mif2p [Lachancea thermotolerans CBS 6340]|uniref:KLTH0D05984p n=1 Tax=Lachancea thermotolerans (strain ATCC 56472 / CBS 6340 / NRRL Y-8284) TaxID=559295 RepID=C5DGK1_LACTC|nr:KLTH0D05984p [Lachancea thermotolerans CBS 6340]CAR22543.1 KLTH0D05984p [Lachancea thermotolerans CBS 6340]